MPARPAERRLRAAPSPPPPPEPTVADRHREAVAALLVANVIAEVLDDFGPEWRSAMDVVRDRLCATAGRQYRPSLAEVPADADPEGAA